MVSYKEILASNALINDSTAPRIAVFVGGTSGIGKFTIKALVATGTTVKIYLVGRKNSKERTQAFIEELHALNPKASVIWTEAEVALLADVRRVCDIIKSNESRVDLLFLTAGYAPFGTRKETAEGHEVVQALEYYSRMLFILRLLPLLGESGLARVVSVLGGGLETTWLIDLDDWDLKRPGNFKVYRARLQYLAMNTITLDKLARENPNVTFIHSWPGSVNTGNVRRGWDANSIIGGTFSRVFEFLTWLAGFSGDESGQRHLFEITSAAFGGRGVPWIGKAGITTTEQLAGGLFLVNYKCDYTLNAKVVAWLREKGQEKLWEHTQELLGPYF
ncbi:putative dehydrogenase [Triangularia setosa]|uniref:Dehydrogenase n=1 Tax=Triangularia setosa TaxID=2587417 RepID=A0AAN6VZ15_9PEZI|nr:putative dehydrogenase [Podospora setosa]